MYGKFFKQDSISFETVHYGDKDFKTLVIPKTLALTALVNSHNYQGDVGTNETYSLI